MKSSQTFADNVRRILKDNGIKIGKFEEKVGLQQGSLSRLSVAQLQTMKLDLALNIADELGMSIDEIFNYNGVQDV